MSERKDGGPAFPHIAEVIEMGRESMTTRQITDHGMSLRDYFAIHGPEPTSADIDAQVGLDRARNPHNDPHKPPIRRLESIRAELRYRFADTMLAAREKT